jgi:hypothetical protein
MGNNTNITQCVVCFLSGRSTYATSQHVTVYVHIQDQTGASPAIYHNHLCIRVLTLCSFVLTLRHNLTREVPIS